LNVARGGIERKRPVPAALLFEELDLSASKTPPDGEGQHACYQKDKDDAQIAGLQEPKKQVAERWLRMLTARTGSDFGCAQFWGHIEELALGEESFGEALSRARCVRVPALFTSNRSHGKQLYSGG
jgi:hypothetical protein